MFEVKRIIPKENTPLKLYILYIVKYQEIIWNVLKLKMEPEIAEA